MRDRSQQSSLVRLNNACDNQSVDSGQVFERRFSRNTPEQELPLQEASALQSVAEESENHTLVTE